MKEHRGTDTVSMASVSRRQRGQAGHAALMKAARALFSRKGFDNASVEEICLAAGYSKGGFYFHFRSKEDLLFRMLQSGVVTTPDWLDALALELWAAAGRNDVLRAHLAQGYESRRHQLTDRVSASEGNNPLTPPPFVELLLLLEDGLAVQRRFASGPSLGARLFVRWLIEELTAPAAEASA